MINQNSETETQLIASLQAINQRLIQEMQERQRVEEALRESSERLKTLINAMPDLVCFKDASGRWLEANQATLELFQIQTLDYQGKSDPELVELVGQIHGKNFYRNALINFQKSDQEVWENQQPSQQQEIIPDVNGNPRIFDLIKVPLFHPNGERKSSQIFATLEDGLVRHVDNEVFRHRNGSDFPVEYVSTPIQNQGEIIGAVVIFKDITERQAMEKMKDEFISVVSHELRTPLTSIHGALGLLASGLLDTQPERAKRMFEIAVTNTTRLVRLINDILDLERMQAGQITLDKKYCNLADLMVQANNEMIGMAEKSGVNLSIKPLEVHLWVAPDRIIQVFTNLLSNAIRFSDVDSCIWFDATLHHSSLSRSCLEVLITLQDQGRGIPTDKLETIFGRFQQVDASDSRQKGGTGLGLAICRSIVQQHGGHIWAESQLGQGSTFFVRLPVASEVAEDIDFQ
jgi:signal transduction histidine kinase